MTPNPWLQPPCVEVGWRLAFRFWGYATEGGRAALHVAFRCLNQKEVVSFTSVGNIRSRGVMERLGMHATELFDHPKMTEGHRLRQHCLYRLSVEDHDAQPCLAPDASPAALRLLVSRR